MRTEPLNRDYIKDRVSVIIPSYNYAHFIPDCLNSVFSQEIDDIEVIVIDDGSTDNTGEVLKPYADRIRYIRQENAGLSSARNHGLRLCTGEYILFLDSDDLLGENSILARLVLLRNKPDIGIAVCRNKLFSSINDKNEPVIFGEWPLFRRDLDIHLYYFNIAPPHAFLMRRSVYLKVGYFDEKLRACEDYDYWLRCLINGCRFETADNSIVYYRKHQASMSANSENQLNHDYILHTRMYNYTVHDTTIRNSPPFLAAMTAGMITTSWKISRFDKKRAEALLNMIADVTVNYPDYGKFMNMLRLSVTVNIYYLQTVLILKKLQASSCMSNNWPVLIDSIKDFYPFNPRILFLSIINLLKVLKSPGPEKTRLTSLIYRIILSR